MPFRYKDDELHHTPQWYHDNCRAEDGGSAVFRGMLKRDMKLIDADFDSEMCYQENIYNYEERFQAVSSGRDGYGDTLISYCADVLERECGVLDPNVNIDIHHGVIWTIFSKSTT